VYAERTVHTHKTTHPLLQQLNLRILKTTRQGDHRVLDTESEKDRRERVRREWDKGIEWWRVWISRKESEKDIYTYIYIYIYI